MANMNETAADIVITDIYIKQVEVNNKLQIQASIKATLTIIDNKIPNLVGLFHISNLEVLTQNLLLLYLTQIQLQTLNDISMVIDSINKTIHVPFSFYMGASAMQRYLNQKR